MPDSTTTDDAQLLRWIAPSQGSDTQDPLGMELRVSARLAAQLLHCITSITPRARYYSFLAWCLTDYVRSQRKTAADRGLEDALLIREKAYALGCIASHDGDTCEGGGIVGSERASDAIGSDAERFNLRDTSLFQNGPSDAYLGSLINLGMFVETDRASPEDGDLPADETTARPTWDDVQITSVCKSLGEAFGQSISKLPIAALVRDNTPIVTRQELMSFGLAACPCRLSERAGQDRTALLDLFFARTGTGHQTHLLRRRTLLLLMACIRRTGSSDVPFDRFVFADAVVYGFIQRADDVVEIALPDALRDIAEKWLMFHLHGYAAVALESAFAWLVREADQAGTTGLSFEAIGAALAEKGIVAGLLGDASQRQLRFGEMTAIQTFQLIGVDLAESSEAIGFLSPLSERRLADRLTGHDEVETLGTGLATVGVLLAATLARLRPRTSTENGNWLGAESRNPHLDLSPPILERWLKREFSDWHHTPWSEWMPRFLQRFVIRQHEMMGYEKAKDNRSIILNHVDECLFASGHYPRATIGNPRLGSALRILQDLLLISRRDDDVLELTDDGEGWLSQELEAEA